MTTSSQEPILASWKISEVLQRYPQLLDELVAISPAFTKLRNPVLRRVQTRLVTVAQAAQIAGLDPAVLVRRLNEAAGITSPVAVSTYSDGDQAGVSEDAPPWVEGAPVAAELDVRPMLERGEEPFKAIMKSARPVPIGSALRLIAGFEPVPLYDVLGKQGFVPWARQDASGDWEIIFYRERAAGDAPPAPDTTARAPQLDWNEPAASEVTIDVSELVPPEPMIKILQALEGLPPGGRLLVHHVRRPMHLYDRLDEMGYAHDTRELAPDRIEVLIQKGPREMASVS